MKLKPQLVITSGIAATGKSSTLAEVAREVDNLFVLEKDLVNQGSLHVSRRQFQNLPNFQQYVGQDNVFPGYAHEVETPFGMMWQVDPKNDFYGRHGRDQAYVIMGSIAKRNLELGKVPVIDCFVHRQIADGTLRRFMEQECFRDYQTNLVHFTCTEDECYGRRVERAKVDSQARVRDGESISSRERFHRFVTEEQLLVPTELQSYKHLLLDTTGKSPEECAREMVHYLER